MRGRAAALEEIVSDTFDHACDAFEREEMGQEEGDDPGFCPKRP